MTRLGIGGFLTAGAASALAGFVIAKRSDEAARNTPEIIGYPPLDILKPVAEDVWIVDSGPIRPSGLALPIRMTVIRLANGDLMLHSPTCFTSTLAAQLAEIGQVRYLIAPNTAHWSFLPDWQANFPDAEVWAAPGLREKAQVKRAGIRIDRDLGERAPRAWDAEIEQGVLRGIGGFSEVYFFHRPSKTLILADLIHNLDPRSLPLLTDLVARFSGSTGGKAAFHMRAALKPAGHRASAAAACMIALQPDRVIFAHGDWFESNGAARLRRSLDWLLPAKH